MSAKTSAKSKPQRKPSPPEGCEVLLTRAAVAAALGIGVRKLDKLVAGGHYPPPVRLPGLADPRWYLADHNRWVRSHREGAGAEGSDR